MTALNVVNAPSTALQVTNTGTRMVQLYGALTNATSSTATWSTTNLSTSTITCTDPESLYIQDGLREILFNQGIEIYPGVRLRLDRQGRPSFNVQGRPSVNVTDDLKITKIIDGPVDFDEIQFSRSAIVRMPDGSVIKPDKNGSLTAEVFLNAAEKKFIDVLHGSIGLYESLAFCHFHQIAIPQGAGGCELELPNGTTIRIKGDDTVEINDKDAKVLYKSAPTRNFNQYLNASDLLEEFISYCKQQNITQKQFDDLPVSMFIMWLIVRTAEQDNDDPGEALPLLTTSVKQTKMHTHRCRCCGKFLNKKFENNQIAFCSPSHMERFMEKSLISC